MEKKEKNLNQLSETSDVDFEVKLVNGEQDSAKISSESINMPEVTLFPSEFEDQEIENDIMLEEMDVFNPHISLDILTSPTSPKAVQIDGIRERINSVAIEVLDEQYIKYKRCPGVNIKRPSMMDGTVTLASAFLEDEEFSTVVFMNPLTKTRNFFEVEITNEGSSCVFAVGVGPRNYPTTIMPGWIEGSFGYHANGNLFIEQGDAPIKGPRGRKGDRMGCGLDFSTMEEGYVQVWFTKNGRLACWPESVPCHTGFALYPLISVGSSGEVVHYCAHKKEDIPDIATIYPWYVIAGFTDTSEVPFFSRKESVVNYGSWLEEPSLTDHSDVKIPWENLRESLGNNLPEALKILGELSPASYAEWLEMAQNLFKRNEKFAACSKAPNGTQLKRNEQMAIFIAKEVLATLINLQSGHNLKQIAILGFMSLGVESHFLKISVVGGLLYMGCSANSSLKYRHVLHNPDISVSIVRLLLNWGGNPNCEDAIGRTPLHVHQNNRGLMRTFLAHNADVNALDDERSTPLHYAGVNGRTGVAELLIMNGAEPNASFGGRPSSLDYTAAAGNFNCFKRMLKLSIKNMTKKKIQQQSIEDKWKDAVSDLPKWKKIKLKEIEEMTNDQFYYVTVKQHQSDEDRYSLKKLVTVANENKIDFKTEVFTTIFDHCLYGQTAVIADILDADVNGDVDPHSVNMDEGTSLFTYLSKKPKLLLTLVNHETMKAYIADKWQKKALLTFWIRVLLFLFQLILLTFALAIAARPGLTDADINTYSSPIDIFRGVCEAAIILFMLSKIFDEVIELVLGGVTEYLMDLKNYLQWLGVILILLIIPLRAVNHPGQWIVASLAYFAFGLRALYLASLFDSTGTYIQALLIIISRDVVKFLAMFLIVLIIFGGTFYLSARYDVSIALSNMTEHVMAHDGEEGPGFHSGETSYLHEVYFSGFRTMIESGPTLDYYEHEAKFNLLAVIFYLLFLFIVVIVLLNVLIAQVSDTYAKVLETAEGYKLFNQCLYIAQLERQNNKICMTSGIYLLVQKCNCCTRFYNCCCQTTIIRKIFEYFKGANDTMTRPRILSIGQVQEKSSNSKLWTVKKKLQQVSAHYLPNTLEASEKGEGEDDLELKVDTTNQNLKELGQDLNAVLNKQHQLLTNMVTNNQCVLMSELSTQEVKILTDIHLSEEQEGLMKDFLTQLKEVHKDMTEQLTVMKMQNGNDQLMLQSKLEEIRQQHEEAKEQMTLKQEELQQEVARKQEEVKVQLAQQDEDLRRDIEDHQSRLHSQLLIQKKEMEDLAQQQEETKEYFSHQYSGLDAKITTQQMEVREQLYEQDREMKANIAHHQEALQSMMGEQQEELRILTQKQEQSKDFFSFKHGEMETKLNLQQQELQLQIARQQQELMVEFTHKWGEVSKIINNEVIAINKDFLYLFESAAEKVLKEKSQ